jgi:excisionase family DNA binding protein
MTVPAYLDIDRMCTELCISERTVDAWVRQGVLPSPRMRGGKRLWKWIEVERYLDDGGPSVTPSADRKNLADGMRWLAKWAQDRAN